MTEYPMSNPWKALPYTFSEGPDNTPLLSAVTAIGIQEETKKGEGSGVFNVCLILFWFCLFILV